MSQFLVALAILSLTGHCLAGHTLVPLNQVSGPGVAPVRQRAVAVPVEQVSYRPYDFGYEFGNGLGMTQHRRETADGTGAVRGSYGYQDPIGVSRVVEYTADRDGYRTIIRTNEPGVVGQNPADATFVVQPPPAAAVAQGLYRRLIEVA